MQMLCNIFPIPSSQLMKISSFEQFLVLKKNIWAWQSMEHDHLNKLSITFQQKDQCEIWWKLAKWFLKNHDFIHVNSTVHYENTPMQKCRKFHLQKTEKKNQIKTSDIFHISVQNIDCGYSLEPPRWGGSNEYPQSMFWAEIGKIMYTPVNPRFTI